MDFKELLAKGEYDLGRVMVMRHSPNSPRLRRQLRWAAQEQIGVYNAYQRVQGESSEKALQKAEIVASFLAEEDGQHALFVGLYRRGGWRQIIDEQLWAMPEIAQLLSYGMNGLGARKTALWFDLEPLEDMADLKGRLLVKWPPGRLWWRWAKSNDFIVRAIHQESVLDANMPPWDNLALSWDELKALPTKWKSTLAQWRGIYFIFDISKGKGYVGSAYGIDNILGRWMNYADSGHGGNKLLKLCDPQNFRFSILQLVSPVMESENVIRIESTWKARLHTREYGLNEN